MLTHKRFQQMSRRELVSMVDDKIFLMMYFAEYFYLTTAAVKIVYLLIFIYGKFI